MVEFRGCEGLSPNFGSSIKRIYLNQLIEVNYIT